MTDNTKRLLPPGWRWVKLGEVCEFNPKRSILDRQDDALTSFVPMSAIDEKNGEIISAEKRLFAEVKNGYTYFTEGDVLFAKITPCMQNGKHAIARELIDGIGFGSTEFHVIRPGPYISSEWVHLFVRQSLILDNAKAHFTGAVGQQRVPQNYLMNLDIPLPPLIEQNRIVLILNEQMSVIERARTAAQTQLNNAKALLDVYLRQAFPESGKKLPNGWRWIMLGEHADFRNGINFSNSQKGSGVLTVDVLNMYSYGLNVDTSKLYRVNTNNINDYILKDGDILFVRSSVKKEGVGWTSHFTSINEPVCYCGFIIRCRLKNKIIDPRFLTLCLRSPNYRTSIIEGSGTGTITNINQEMLFSLQIPIPSLTDQINIATNLIGQMDIINKLQMDLQTQLEEVNALPAALLRKAFNGEL